MILHKGSEKKALNCTQTVHFELGGQVVFVGFYDIDDEMGKDLVMNHKNEIAKNVNAQEMSCTKQYFLGVFYVIKKIMTGYN